MNELPTNHELSTESPLDRARIAVAIREMEVDIDFEDWDGLDDNEVLGNIATLATIYDLDIDQVLQELTPIEKRRHEEDGESSEI